MRRFWLVRDEDDTGISGTGVVACGVQFPNGKASLSWQTQHTSVAVYDDIETVEAIHGHRGMTRVVWVDPERSPQRALGAEYSECARDFAGEPIREGDEVMPIKLMGAEREPMQVVRAPECRNGVWTVSAVGWPECGYGLGAERADRVRVVRKGALDAR